MEHAGTGIGHVGDDGNQLERIHELDGGLAVALQPEGNDAAGAVGQIFLCQLIGIVAGQSAVVHPCHAVVGLQKFGNALGVGTMALHAQMERLQSEVQQEGVGGRRYAAQVAHNLGYELGDIGHLAESLCIGQSVVGLVGGGQSGESMSIEPWIVEVHHWLVTLVGAGFPVEVSAVHHAAAHLCGVSVHILSSAVGHDVGSPLKGSAVDGCGEGVVDDERHVVAVGYACEFLNVEHSAAGV